MMEIDYKLLKALCAVIKEQSFEGASKKLCISQSAVSQRIKLLEESFASPVLIRSTPIKPTILGSKLLNHYGQINQLELSLFDELSTEDKNKPISIAIALNADSLASWFIPAISPLLQKYNIEVDFYISNEYHTQNLLKKGEVYSALSSQPLGIANSKVTHIGDMKYKLCATPKFISKYFKNGLNKESLRNAPGVDFDQLDNMHEDYIEKHFNVSKGEYPCHRVRSSEAVVNMILNDLAFALLPHTQADKYLTNGELIELTPNKQLTLPLYWHSWLLEKGVQKSLTEHVISWGEKYFY